VSTSDFRPIELFRKLARHDVRYVLIGGLAATLHGSPLTTADVDICPSTAPSNLKRLAAALSEMRARIYSDREPDGIELVSDGESLSRVEIWNLVTEFGRLDISYQPAGTQGYEDLRRDAVEFELDGVVVAAASLADVIRSKEAAGRERDRQALPTLRRLLGRSGDDDV
jgi:hypothetical protein